ncbi:hypothetical protein Scep_019293 [Stephania cephalantha]|uniref:Uncharacterized protein n=1 Tax=Stephania cephalantha TaxID=152367 RepID=A0AAP0NMR7_9MAGN
MSIALLQDYSSEEEQEKERVAVALSDKEDEEEDEKAHIQTKSYKPFDFPKPSTDSILPSALDAFSEAKAELVGIRDRVRCDIDGNATSTFAARHMKGNPATTVGEGNRDISRI